jgi:hypothetical protein
MRRKCCRKIGQGGRRLAASGQRWMEDEHVIFVRKMGLPLASLLRCTILSSG